MEILDNLDNEPKESKTKFTQLLPLIVHSLPVFLVTFISLASATDTGHMTMQPVIISGVFCALIWILFFYRKDIWSTIAAVMFFGLIFGIPHASILAQYVSVSSSFDLGGVLFLIVHIALNEVRPWKQGVKGQTKKSEFVIQSFMDKYRQHPEEELQAMSEDPLAKAELKEAVQRIMEERKKNNDA